MDIFTVPQNTELQLTTAWNTQLVVTSDSPELVSSELMLDKQR